MRHVQRGVACLRSRSGGIGVALRAVEEHRLAALTDRRGAIAHHLSAHREQKIRPSRIGYSTTRVTTRRVRSMQMRPPRTFAGVSFRSRCRDLAARSRVDDVSMPRGRHGVAANICRRCGGDVRELTGVSVVVAAATWRRSPEAHEEITTPLSGDPRRRMKRTGHVDVLIAAPGVRDQRRNRSRFGDSSLESFLDGHCWSRTALPRRRVQHDAVHGSSRRGADMNFRAL